MLKCNPVTRIIPDLPHRRLNHISGFFADSDFLVTTFATICLGAGHYLLGAVRTIADGSDQGTDQTFGSDICR